MVQSNGTRDESQRFRIDFTGRRKYSGRPADFRWLSAGGEHAARRAMPTSGTAAFRVRPSARLLEPCGTASCEAGGGQSAVGQPEMLPPKPALVEASTFKWRPPGEAPAFGVGLVAEGLTGKSVAVDCVARRRGIPKFRAVEERTGDIAHLEARRQYFAFCSPCQEFFAFPSSIRMAWRQYLLPLTRYSVCIARRPFTWYSACSGGAACDSPHRHVFFLVRTLSSFRPPRVLPSPNNRRHPKRLPLHSPKQPKLKRLRLGRLLRSRRISPYCSWWWAMISRGACGLAKKAQNGWIETAILPSRWRRRTSCEKEPPIPGPITPKTPRPAPRSLYISHASRVPTRPQPPSSYSQHPSSTPKSARRKAARELRRNSSPK